MSMPQWSPAHHHRHSTKPLSYFHISLPQQVIHHTRPVSSPPKADSTFLARLEGISPPTTASLYSSRPPTSTRRVRTFQNSAGHDVRPPTAGGGPLSSHPTTPDEVAADMSLPGAFPLTPSADTDDAQKQYFPEGKIHDMSTLASQHSENERERSESFRAPTSPASATQTPQTPTVETSPSPTSNKEQRPPSPGVKRLLSFNNLRASFAGSGTSLASPEESSETKLQPQNPAPTPSPTAAPRPQTQQPSVSSPTSQRNPISTQIQTPTKRPPTSPSTSFSTTTTTSPLPTTSSPSRPQSRKSSNGSWFRRKSGLWGGSGKQDLQSVQEQVRPESKRQRGVSEQTPPPRLPELGLLGKGSKGQGLTGSGEIGWEEEMFGR